MVTSLKAHGAIVYCIAILEYFAISAHFNVLAIAAWIYRNQRSPKRSSNS